MASLVGGHVNRNAGDRPTSQFNLTRMLLQSFFFTGALRVFLRLKYLFSIFFQFSDTVCGNSHCPGGNIVTIHSALKCKYELTIYYLVRPEIIDQNTEIIFVSVIIFGARQ